MGKNGYSGVSEGVITFMFSNDLNLPVLICKLKTLICTTVIFHSKYMLTAINLEIAHIHNQQTTTLPEICNFISTAHEQKNEQHRREPATKTVTYGRI